TGEQLEDMFLYWDDKTAELTEQIAAGTVRVHTLQERINQLEDEKRSSEQREHALQKNIQESAAANDALESHNKHLISVINDFTQSSSWKITAPLRFVSRIVHGQHREAWDGLRRRMLPFGKKIYRALPVRERQRLLAIIYRFAGRLFTGTEHYELWRIEQQYAGNPSLIHTN